MDCIKCLSRGRIDCPDLIVEEIWASLSDQEWSLDLSVQLVSLFSDKLASRIHDRLIEHYPTDKWLSSLRVQSLGFHHLDVCACSLEIWIGQVKLLYPLAFSFWHSSEQLVRIVIVEAADHILTVDLFHIETRCKLLTWMIRADSAWSNECQVHLLSSACQVLVENLLECWIVITNLGAQWALGGRCRTIYVSVRCLCISQLFHGKFWHFILIK